MIRHVAAAIAFIMCAILIWFFLALPNRHVYARDLDGHYAQENPELHRWFQGLHGQGNMVPCCDIADGEKISDVDWDTKDGHYRVHLDGKWIDVPDSAVVTTPNKFGPAVVWPIRYRDEISIRCFMPGTLS